MNNTSILIIEDELITAESIQQLLKDEEYSIAGIAKDAQTALAIAKSNSAASLIAICDIHIKGDINGVELAGQLKKNHTCEVIFLTAFSDQKTLQSAFHTDPVMYLVKPYTDKQLLVAVQMAFHKLYEKQKAAASITKLDLTEREKEIALLVAQGFSSKQVSRQLNISIETVKTHRRRMLSKNNVSSFPHLVYLMNNES